MILNKLKTFIYLPLTILLVNCNNEEAIKEAVRKEMEEQKRLASEQAQQEYSSFIDNLIEYGKIALFIIAGYILLKIILKIISHDR